MNRMDKPRIGIPVHQLAHLRTGVETYTRALVDYVPAADREREYWLFGPWGWTGNGGPARVAPTRFPTRSPALKVVWEQMLLPALARRYRLDLLHIPLYVAPRWGPTPFVLTVHDLSFLRFPEWFRGRDRWYKGKLGPASFRRAAAVITDAAATQQELTALCGVAPERIAVVPLGVDAARFRPAPAEDDGAEIRCRYACGRPYLLFVGTLEPRKNLPRLVAAFAQARAATGAPHALVLAGRWGWGMEGLPGQVRQLGLEKDVIFIDYVPEEDLPGLYRAAAALAYPSLYEGFGLPPLEAMACGTPVLTSNVSSLPEVVGEAAWKVDPTNVEQIAAGLIRLIQDADLRKELRQRGRARAREFSWERMARETVKVYDAVLAHVKTI